MPTEEGGGFVGTIVIIGLGIFAFWYFRNQQAMAAQAAQQAASVAPGTGQQLENVAISSIPLAGPALDITVNKINNAIATNQTLKRVSEVADGHSTSQAGVLSVNYDTHINTVSVITRGGHYIAKALEFWNW